MNDMTLLEMVKDYQELLKQKEDLAEQTKANNAAIETASPTEFFIHRLSQSLVLRLDPGRITDKLDDPVDVPNLPFQHRL